METDLVGAVGEFSESEFLRTIALHDVGAIRDSLASDGAPDIDLEQQRIGIGLEAIMKPLETLRFPRDNLYEYACLLRFMIVGYASDEPEHDALKLVYVCSFYIHCYVLDSSNTQDNAFPVAVALLVSAARIAGPCVVGRVARFLLWAVRHGTALPDRDCAPGFHLLMGAAQLMSALTRTVAEELSSTLQHGRSFYAEVRALHEETSHHEAQRLWLDIVGRWQSVDLDYLRTMQHQLTQVIKE